MSDLDFLITSSLLDIREALPLERKRQFDLTIALHDAYVEIGNLQEEIEKLRAESVAVVRPVDDNRPSTFRIGHVPPAWHVSESEPLRCEKCGAQFWTRFDLLGHFCGTVPEWKEGEKQCNRCGFVGSADAFLEHSCVPSPEEDHRKMVRERLGETPGENPGTPGPVEIEPAPPVVSEPELHEGGGAVANKRGRKVIHVTAAQVKRALELADRPLSINGIAFACGRAFSEQVAADIEEIADELRLDKVWGRCDKRAGKSTWLYSLPGRFDASCILPDRQKPPAPEKKPRKVLTEARVVEILTECGELPIMQILDRVPVSRAPGNYDKFRAIAEKLGLASRGGTSGVKMGRPTTLYSLPGFVPSVEEAPAATAPPTTPPAPKAVQTPAKPDPKAARQELTRAEQQRIEENKAVQAREQAYQLQRVAAAVDHLAPVDDAPKMLECEYFGHRYAWPIPAKRPDPKELAARIPECDRFTRAQVGQLLDVLRQAPSGGDLDQHLPFLVPADAWCDFCERYGPFAAELASLYPFERKDVQLALQGALVSDRKPDKRQGAARL